MRQIWSLLLCVAAASSTAAAHDGVPVPSDSRAVEAARQRIYELLEDLVNSRSPAAARELATTLMDRASQSEVGSPNHYAMLDEALKAASRSGDVRLALSYLDTMLDTYRVNEVRTSFVTLVAVDDQGADPVSTTRLAERLLALPKPLVLAGSPKDAASCVARVKSIARDHKIDRLLPRCKLALAELEVVRDAQSRAQKAHRRLGSDPEHARSHLDLARFAWLISSDSAEMLEHLAQGPEGELRALAEAEVEADPVDEQVLGQARRWVQAASTLRRDPVLREACYARADEWFAVALGQDLDGLAKLELEAERRAIQAQLAPRRRYLSELSETGVRVGYATLFKNGELPPGVPEVVQMLRGEFLLHSIFLHPGSDDEYSYARYDLEQAWGTLEGSATVADSGGKPARPLRFVVVGDDEILYRSAPVTGQSDEPRFSVSVKGVRFLELRVYSEGVNTSAHALWVEPRLSRE